MATIRGFTKSWTRLSTHTPLFIRSVWSHSLQPHDSSTPDLSVPHHLPKFGQVHVHCISDVIQPSHPLMPSSPSAPSISQHQGLLPMNQLFASDDQNTGVSASASVLPTSIQGLFPLRFTALISLLSKGLSGVFSSSKASTLCSPSYLQSSSHNRM